MKLTTNQPTYRMILTRTPVRISFGGGGTDFPDYFERDFGAVLSTTIDKYIYVSVKRHGDLFHEPIRLNYSITELANSLDEIQNHIVRECLRFLEIAPPIYISTVSDLPASTGLGGSRAFTVGLLNALHEYKNERVSPGRLAEEASYIELEVLKQPIGKQDQYAAAFGGLNYFRFNPGGGVAVESVRCRKTYLNDLFDHSLLFWTDVQRSASDILVEQRQNIPDRVAQLDAMREQAAQLKRMAENGPFDPVAFGRVLREAWGLKRQLASSISTGGIDAYFERAISAGAEGGKLCGAGRGGFLLFIVRPEYRVAVRQALSELIEIPVRGEVHGSRLLVPTGD
jgi:D-glycero-alpha-D-manno-heptose-7-phosphate kinase